MWMMCRKVQVGWPCVLHMFRVPGTVYKVPCKCTFAILGTVPPMALPLLPILRTDLFGAAFTLSLSCFGTVYFYQERLQTSIKTVLLAAPVWNTRIVLHTVMTTLFFPQNLFLGHLDHSCPLRLSF